MSGTDDAEKQPVRSIEDLKGEYEKLNERKIQTQTQLEGATKQLETLQQQAVDEFGTSDIEELRIKLEQMETENERRRREYQELLEGITRELEKVEADAKSPANSGKAGA